MCDELIIYPGTLLETEMEVNLESEDGTNTPFDLIIERVD